MTTENLPQASRSNEFSFRLASNALVALMMTCAAFTLLSLIDRLAPGWQPIYLPALCFAAALERLYTHRRFAGLALFSREWSTAMSGEWLMIILLVKLVTGLSHGPGAFYREILGWVQNFNLYFLTDEFVFALVLVILTWFLSGSFAGLLAEMDLAQAILIEADPAAQIGKPPARERLLSLIFSLGSALIVFTALVRVDLRAFFQHTSQFKFSALPALAGGGASTLLYFMLGMALLSQTRFIDLHTRWSVQHIPVNRKLGRSWAFYSLGFLGLIAALVALLPTSYSLATLTAIGQGLENIAYVLFFIAQGLVAVVLFVLSLPFVLFGRTPATLNNRILPPTLPDAASGGEPGATSAWLAAVKMLIFWVIFLAVLFFALRQYLRQHTEVLAALRKISTRLRLTRLWHWLRGMFISAGSLVSRGLQAGRERLRRASASVLPANSFYAPRNLDPRQKITFFYLAMIHRGAEKGIPRRPSQTPYEYASKLDEAVPDAEEDIDTLTQAFIEARYSPHSVQAEQVNLVKSTWERLRKTIRKKPSG